MHNKKSECSDLEEELRDRNIKTRNQMSTSTPNTTVSGIKVECECEVSPNVSAIERSGSPPIHMSEDSLETPTPKLKSCCPPCHLKDARSSSSIELSPSTSFFWKREKGSKHPRGKKLEKLLHKKPNKDGLKVKCLCADSSSQTKNKPKPEVLKSKSYDDACQCDDSEKEQEGLKQENSCLKKLVKGFDLKISAGGSTSKDSGGVCSLTDSATCACDGSVCAQYYSNKLLSTLQVLQNREETIRVQAESLSVAEGRIAALNERVADLRQEADRRTKELQSVRKKLDSYNVQKSDACISVDTQLDQQSVIVTTLQNNLSVIEELYRECFYETAKQENLIDMLRNSYLDVRLMERKKADRIGHLQTVINKQKMSLERCQDIALEVDNLKTEITNFLSGSSGSTSSPNNDSGMWERSEEAYPDVQEDLQEMMEKLLRLRDLLESGCICGLEAENKQLKEDNANLTTQISELKQRVCGLASDLTNVERTRQKYEQTIQEKEREKRSLEEQLEALKEGSVCQSNVCEGLSAQLSQVQESLESKTCELTSMRQQCEAQETTIHQLREELLKVEQLRQENCKLRSEVSFATSELTSCREQLKECEGRARSLAQQLQRAVDHQQHMEKCYREKAGSVAALQAQLEEAHARGAALCGEARHSVAAVRRWAQRMRTQHRENERSLKEKEELIITLQRQLAGVCSPTECACSHRTYSLRASSRTSSPSTSSAPPVPPKRNAKKSVACGERSKPCTCQCNVPVQHATCSAPQSSRATHVQRPHRFPRDISPTEEFCNRMEQLYEAWEDGQRRWSRVRDQR